MKHIIVGTSGHIDHGKTTLIKALTGKETDRLKEEKDRGISIELGFTYFDLPSHRRVGIIDVPGHEKFIKNMLAGVVGIDIVLLVVAADEGVMPQTIEHLEIMNLMGIEKGFIVMTKTDLVDEEWLELVAEDIRQEVKGSFLENSPIIPVSSTKKTGTEDVINLIDKMSNNIEDKNEDDMPRLSIDRVFTIQGFGTVVTGTLISGQLKLGDEIQIFPSNKLGKVRSLEVHGDNTDIAYAGQRVAVNIAGVKKEEVHRGDVLAPKDSMKETSMLDVKLKMIKNLEHIIENRSRVRLYIGTKEVLCRIVILDKEKLGAGDEAFAQLRLEEKVVAKREDRFILRFYSPMYTIGGGEILEPNPSKKKRFDTEAIEELKIKESGDSKDIIEKIILDNSYKFPTIKEISAWTSMLERNVKQDMEILYEEEKIIVFDLTKDIYVIHNNYFDQLKDQILESLESFHNKYTLRTGIPKEEIRSKYLSQAKPLVGDKFINILIDKELVEQHMENISSKEFKVKYNDLQLDIKDKLVKLLTENSFIPPKKEELINSLEYDKNDIEEVFNSLIDNGEIVKLNEDVYMHKDNYNEALNLLKEYIKKEDSITVAIYRDLLNTNRRVAIALLEYFDQKKVTRREGDKRKLVN